MAGRQYTRRLDDQRYRSEENALPINGNTLEAFRFYTGCYDSGAMPMRDAKKLCLELFDEMIKRYCDSHYDSAVALINPFTARELKTLTKALRETRRKELFLWRDDGTLRATVQPFTLEERV